MTKSDGTNTGEADPLHLIQQIVQADDFVLNDEAVERVLNLLAKVVVEHGRDAVVLKVPGLGRFDVSRVEGRLAFQFIREDG